MSDIRVVRGNDGKMLGVTCSDGTNIDRRTYDDWESFCDDVVSLAWSRIPQDTESEFAKNLIAADDERLRKMSVIP